MLSINSKNRYAPVSKALKEKTEGLVSRFLMGKAPDFLKQHSLLLDDYFRESFEMSMVGPRMGINKNPYAIIAMGGYGRQEQCIHSDVDLLFLFKKGVPGEAEELIREVIYPLWDIGLEVGYATRSIKECVALSAKDFDILTPILDARFVCGMSLLYSDLMESLRRKVIVRRSTKIIDWLITSNRERHDQFGDSAYRLEPNLKEGQGGLRDYHTMLWISQVKHNLEQPRDLEYFGFLSQAEYQTLIKAITFIWNIRNRLHHMTGRKCDQLLFQYQVKLAEVLNFSPIDGEQPVERFLGKLHGQMEFIKQQHLMFLYEMAHSSRKMRKRFARETTVTGLEIKKETLGFASPEVIIQSPDLLIKIFEESARLKIPLGAVSKRLVREFSYLVDEKFSTSRTAVKAFERILVSPAPKFNVLNEMLSSGFLVRFIPEINQIVNRIQYDEYHVFPVDKHCLRVVQTLKKFGTPEDPSSDALCGKIYKEVKHRKLLLWASLLHDIGKGLPGGDHSQKGAEIVRHLLLRKGYKPREIDTAVFLVKEHLFLIKTATRRDINDEETAIMCARKIKDINLLKMLYLLTVADSIATGPKAWNSWTNTLLRDLFFKVLSILERGELASREAMTLVEGKKAQVLAAVSLEEGQGLETFFNIMSPRYLLYSSPEEILDHVRLYHRMGDHAFVWDINKTPKSKTRTITVCAKDRPGLFSKIAGVLTLNNQDILDAQIYTWRNNIALDIFEVEAHTPMRYSRRNGGPARKKT